MSKMFIEIESSEVNVKSGVKSGKPWEIKEQTGYFHSPGNKYPQQVTLSLRDNQVSYQPGKYQITADSFYVGQYNKLCFNPVLEQVK